MWKKIKVLKNQTDFSVFDDFAIIWSFQAGGTAKQGRLTGTGGADDAEDFALVYFQRNIAEHI